MKQNIFNTLVYCIDNGYDNQRNLAKHLNTSLGTANACISYCKEQKWIDDDNALTQAGKQALLPYKVDNAIIMAAGMSSRFAPLSYEKPKGLLIVKGEVLIERQIRQLQKAGIDDITVVVGYMAEKFYYLKDKFKVRIVTNYDYFRYNNTSTLIKVADQLKNTYICSSDNYFTENVFEQYVYDSYYSAVFIKGKSDEWGLITDKKGRIIGVDHSPTDMDCMLGHVYFSKEFSNTFKEILIQKYPEQSTKERLWEYLLEENLNKLKIYIRRYDADKVLEFDSLEDLRLFDDKYLKNTGSNIFSNICQVLKCDESDISSIEVISQGLTNLSFSFMVNEKRYIYRHPGVGTDKYISRKSEAFSMKIARELGLDTTVVYISGEEGWKISTYIEDNHTLDYHNEAEVKKALRLIKKLHDAKIVSEYDFDIWQVTIDLINKLDKSEKDFADFDELLRSMTELYQLAEADNEPKILCHCDCYDPNFLIDKSGNITLIDWEYSGNDDPGSDLGTFICCSDYSYEEALQVFRWYYNREPTLSELRHKLAYVAIASYYWFIWALYQESLGKIVGEYKMLWYENTKTYMKKAFSLYKGE